MDDDFGFYESDSEVHPEVSELKQLEYRSLYTRINLMNLLILVKERKHFKVIPFSLIIFLYRKADRNSWN